MVETFFSLLVFFAFHEVFTAAMELLQYTQNYWISILTARHSGFVPLFLYFSTKYLYTFSHLEELLLVCGDTRSFSAFSFGSAPF